MPSSTSFQFWEQLNQAQANESDISDCLDAQRNLQACSAEPMKNICLTVLGFDFRVTVNGQHSVMDRDSGQWDSRQIISSGFRFWFSSTTRKLTEHGPSFIFKNWALGQYQLKSIFLLLTSTVPEIRQQLMNKRIGGVGLLFLFHCTSVLLNVNFYWWTLKILKAVAN